MKARKLALALAAASCLAAGAAAACPVCYGDAAGEVIEGTKMSVAFLGSLVYLVLGGGAGMVFAVRRRARRTLDPHHGMKLVKDDSGRAEPATPEERDA